MQTALSEATRSLAGRRVLVSGASRGIGAEIARAFGRCGSVVGVHFNKSQDDARVVAAEIEAAGGRAVLLQAQLLETGAAEDLVRRFVAEAGGIDVLVNNAGGVDRYVHFLEMTPEDWDRSFQLNAAVPTRLSIEAFRHMVAAGFGRIVNIGTTAVKYNGPNSVHYTAAKAAMESAAAALARDGAGKNVLVNTVRCGLIETGMRHTIDGYSDEAYRRRLALVPVGRAGQAGEVAGLVLFLASDAAAFVTRETWAVAGGD